MNEYSLAKVQLNTYKMIVRLYLKIKSFIRRLLEIEEDIVTTLMALCKLLSNQQRFIESKFCTSRGKDGRFSYLRGFETLDLLKGLPFFDIDEKKH